MVVFTGSVSVHAKFTQKLDENWIRAGDKEKSGPNSRDFAIDMSNLNVTLTLLQISLELQYPHCASNVDRGSGIQLHVFSRINVSLYAS